MAEREAEAKEAAERAEARAEAKEEEARVVEETAVAELEERTECPEGRMAPARSAVVVGSEGVARARLAPTVARGAVMGAVAREAALEVWTAGLAEAEDRAATEG